MATFIHTADLHLDSPFSARFDEKQAQARRREQMQTFQQICSLAADKDFLFISGDLFDGRFVSAETVAFLKRCFSQIPQTRVLIAAGNHDPYLSGSVYETEQWGENVYVFKTEMDYVDFPELSVRVHGRSFSKAHEEVSLLTKLSLHDTWCNVLVLHGDLVSLQGKSDYNPLDRQMLQDSGVTYAALGHIHKKSEIDRAGGTYYAYPGIPEGRGFDEEGPKGVYLGEVEKGVLCGSWQELSQRQFLIEYVDLSDCHDRIAIEEKIQAVLDAKDKKHIYRLVLQGTADPAVISGLMLNPVPSTDVFYLELEDETKRGFQQESLMLENTLRGDFVRAMQGELEKLSEDEKALGRLALELGLQAMETGVVS